MAMSIGLPTAISMLLWPTIHAPLMRWRFINLAKPYKKLMTTEQLIKQAQQKQRQGEFAEALALYQQALSEDSKNPDLFYIKSVWYTHN